MNSSPRRLAATVLAVLASACLIGMQSGDLAGAATPARATPLGVATTATRDPSPRARVEKILVFVMENHSRGQMRAGMPFTDRLATRYGYADDYRAVAHPSLPNYLAIAGGSTGGVTDDKPPSDNAVSGRSVFGQALRHGRTARVYAEGMPTRCALENGGGDYAVRHNPWAYHLAERSSCLSHNVGMNAFARDVRNGRLPNVGMVVPNTCHDAHDCSLSVADRWFRKRVRAVMAGPDWASGRLLVVVTADEDDWSHGNVVLTAVAHPALGHVVVRHRLTHYSLSRAMSQVAGGRPLLRAAHARSLLGAFGLRAA